MVFSSLPIFLDPPNWNQHQAHDHSISGGAGGEPPQLLHSQPVAPPPPRPEPGMPSSSSTSQAGGSIRPGSMTDRARLAKIPMQPDQALKCPRCDSTNTKFCYFNNYSLSQPRHFCKTCRRYWTRGGALRNVPVGGGCRRNKRSKSSSSSAAGGSSSKSAATATAAAAASSSSSTATSAGGSSAIPPSIGAPPPTQLPFMASLHPLMDYGGATNIGLGFPGMQVMDPVDHYQVGAGSGVGLEQWRPLGQIQQFPFLGGLEPQLPPPTVPGLYHFDQQGGGDVSTGYSTGKATGSELITQLASVKMEDNNPGGLNLARQFMGVQRNDHFNWGGGNGGTGGGGGGGASGGGGWMTDLSGFNASSTGNLL